MKNHITIVPLLLTGGIHLTDGSGQDLHDEYGTVVSELLDHMCDYTCNKDGEWLGPYSLSHSDCIDACLNIAKRLHPEVEWDVSINDWTTDN